MRIGIDARLLSQTGVGTYTKNLIRHLFFLKESQNCDFYIFYIKSDESIIKQFKHLPNINFIEASSRWHSFQEQTGFLKQIYNYRLDLMHFTYYSHPIFYQRPFVITIHDLITLTHATGQASTWPLYLYKLKLIAAKIAFKHGIYHSKYVITPSKSVKKEIITRYNGVDSKKVIVIYEGLDEDLKNAAFDQEFRKKLPDKYILYVGNFYPHKNINRLIEAYEKVDINIPLILKGPDSIFARKIKSKIDKSKIKKNFIFIHRSLTNDQLYTLYRGASFLIAPSLDEGFGLPVLEAASLSVPVIASRLPVYQEILGDSYLAFDPENISEIRQALLKGLESKLIIPRIQREFSFLKMSRETFQLYLKSLKK